MDNLTVYATLEVKAVGNGASPEEVLDKAIETHSYEIIEKKIGSQPVDNYVSLSEYAKLNNLSNGIYLRKLCQLGKLPGAVKIGKSWCVPKDTPYIDRRFRANGAYSDWRTISGKKRWEVMKSVKNSANKTDSTEPDYATALEERDNITSRP